eukprot:3511897-Heterocapsa_arctica.AAC.1
MLLVKSGSPPEEIGCHLLLRDFLQPGPLVQNRCQFASEVALGNGCLDSAKSSEVAKGFAGRLGPKCFSQPCRQHRPRFSTVARRHQAVGHGIDHERNQKLAMVG